MSLQESDLFSVVKEHLIYGIDVADFIYRLWSLTDMQLQVGFQTPDAVEVFRCIFPAPF